MFWGERGKAPFNVSANSYCAARDGGQRRKCDVRESASVLRRSLGWTSRPESRENHGFSSVRFISEFVVSVRVNETNFAIRTLVSCFIGRGATPMTSQQDARIEAIRNDPDFGVLVGKRSRFAWTLTLLMLFIYFGFILLVAFGRDLLAAPLAGGVTTLGIPIGLGVIVSAFALTGIYVYRANGEFDALTARLAKHVGRS